jgi:cupin fold WbuC family metalloprotein
MIPDQPAPLFFGRACLDALSRSAGSSSRRRKNLNFHAEATHPAQRLLNAVEPDSYIRPHRHRDPLKDETFVVLRGAFGLVLFDAHGGVSHSAVIRADGDLIGAHVPGGTYHCLVSLECGSIFFEAKAGPYVAATDKDFAEWSPPEDDARAPDFLEMLRRLFTAASSSDAA